MRALKTIIRDSLAKKDKAGTQVSYATFGAMLLCVLLVVVIAFQIPVYLARHVWFPDRYPVEPDPPVEVLSVNTPDSFREFIYSNKDRIPGKYIMKLAGQPFPYEYDFTGIASKMKDKECSIALVWTPDGNLLTYYDVNSLKNTADKDAFIENVINEYNRSLIENKFGNYISYESFDVTIDELYAGKENMTAAKILGNMFLPLCVFIVILYASMSRGTTVVAGAKEQGTLAALLMTPVKRSVIVWGNTIGLDSRTWLPLTAFVLLFLLVPLYRGGFIVSFLLMLSLSVFVSSIIILISIMNNSVISAQTAFLPVFFIFIVLCVTMMQDSESFDRIYYFMPLYGHFLGLVSALTGSPRLLDSGICLISTAALTALISAVSVRLLKSERFTVSVMSASDKEIRKARKELLRSQNDYVAKPRTSLFGYKPKKRLPHMSFYISQIVRPLAILSIVQFLSLIPAVFFASGEAVTNVVRPIAKITNPWDLIPEAGYIMAQIMSSPVFLFCMGIGYIIMIAVYVFIVKVLEKNPLSTIGFRRGHALRKYLAGLLAGFGLISGVWLLLIVTGQARIGGFLFSADLIPLFIINLFMWFPQGATEEIMFRGFMLPRIGAGYGLIPAVAVSSLLFCLFHGLNAGFGPLAFINLILISVLYALIAIKTDNIWFLCGAHTMWNLTQGNIYGMEVSGNEGGASLIRTVYTEGHSDLITGGTFGPEGGLAVTVITVIAIVIVLVVFRKKPVKN